MKKKHLVTVFVIGGIAFVGFFLYPLVTAGSISLFPVSDHRYAPLLHMALFYDVLPGLVVGIVLGMAAGLLSPVRHMVVLILPAVLVFLAYLFMHLFQYPMGWSPSFLFTFFIPGWSAFLFGAAGGAAIGRKWRVSKKNSEGSDTNSPIV